MPVLDQSSASHIIYSIDPKRRLVIVAFGRTLRLTDIEAYASSLQENPLFGKDFGEIVDLTEVVDLHLNAEQTITAADRVDPFSLEAKRAFVVRSPEQFHAARMHQLLRPETHVALFRSIEEAEKWIAANGAGRNGSTESQNISQIKTGANSWS